MLITSATIAALQTQFSMLFRQGYDESPEWGTQVATTIPSSVKQNTYGWMARLPSMREWLGPRVIQNAFTHEYVLPNKDYELTVGVDRNDIEDDTLQVYSPIIQDMGRAARKWPDQRLKTVLQAGTTEVTFDGVPFFDTAHPLDPAGVQSNLFAGSALNATNYATVREEMMSYTGEDGEPLGVMPNLLIVPPQLENQGRTILNADMIADPGGIAAGVTNVLKSSASLLVVPELANEPTVWYLADTTRPIRPLVWQLRKAPQILAKNRPTDDNVFFDRQVIFGADSRGNAGYALWFLMARAAA